MKASSFAAALALIAFAGCAKPTSTVATVDLARIQANWPKFINYSRQLAADSDAITRSNASPGQKQQQLAALRQHYVAMQDEVTGDVRDAAQQIATQRNFKLVLTRQFVGYGGTDITADVEKILKITEPTKS